MADKTFKDIALKIDNASASLVDITAHVNQASLEGIQEALENTPLGVDERTYLSGLAGATLPINGFVNTTTDGIFGPLIGNRTSITKTVQYQAYANRFYNGECWVNGVTYSGSAGALETFSASLQFTGAVNRTSKALS